MIGTGTVLGALIVNVGKNATSRGGDKLAIQLNYHKGVIFKNMMRQASGTPP